MERQKNLKKAIEAAARQYIDFSHITLARLANSFPVSENTISNWLLEAVSQRYIPDDTLCLRIMQKHIREYEYIHNMRYSSLRQLYKSAFEKRYNSSEFVDINTMLLAKIN